MEQNKFYQIKNVTEHEYTLVGCDGSVIIRPIQDVDKSASVFTIQDAKDGDVLEFGDHGRLVVGIVSYVNKTTGKVDVNCLLENNNFKVGNYYNLDTIKPHPATKEQCDLLFQKMKEAGYEWDTEKKELNKIIDEKQIKKNLQDNSFRRMFEQNHTWSKEDELSYFESALFTAFSDGWQSYLLGEKVNVKQWAKKHSKELLEDAKKELKCQNPAWSEEDSPYYDDICEILMNLLHSETAKVNKDAVQKDLDWLKSLSPQFTWKPSEGHLKALEDAMNKYHGSYSATLCQLYGELEKLKK